MISKDMKFVTEADTAPAVLAMLRDQADNIEAEPDELTFKVLRFVYGTGPPSEVIASGLTLAEAAAHCQREDTHGYREDGRYFFDGYIPETSWSCGD